MLQTLALGDVQFGSGHAVWLSVVVARKDFASVQNPYPAAGFGQRAKLCFVLGDNAVKVFRQRLLYLRPVIGMHARTPGVRMGLDFLGPKAAHFSPPPVEYDFARLDIPIPGGEVRTPKREIKPFQRSPRPKLIVLGLPGGTPCRLKHEGDDHDRKQ